eukprot:CAMPEP_0184863184 /NCGR_PEP_ID=MMETSP0580-20130426/9767_1 /TAXON_ID=1118495 /ORGANISM="Dactyliosolen fragilissimus" /LENGTH=305 /DNA_ID=CAMNT_0027361365 /DNA_START=1143 /DNA_END=2057 /DNA_ORIENTATION=+
MEKALEALVAKGRRVHNPREQREVAFGLADLSTRTETHHRVVKKGGIKTLINLLKISRDVETRRFATLAIANTCSSPQHREDIAKHEDALLQLTQRIADKDYDFMGRQYCAMALGNLACEPSNHTLISEFGGLEALVGLLQQCVSHEKMVEIDDATLENKNNRSIDNVNNNAIGHHYQTGSYAAFALSNLAATTPQYRDRMVDIGAIEPLIILSCAEEVSVQRKALSALRGICLSPCHRRTVVLRGILDPLILMARADEVDMTREVAAAFNCLSAEPSNRSEITYRAISTNLAFASSTPSYFSSS